MTEHSPAAAMTGAVALLERAINYAFGSLALVHPAALANRTPCRDWDLAALLAHLADSLVALYQAIGRGRVSLVPAVGDDADPVCALREHAGRLLHECARPRHAMVSVAGAPLSASIVSVIGAIEVTVHGWDIAQACGGHRDIPPALAEELLDLAPLVVAGRSEQFDPPIPLPATRPPGDRLLAFLGRVPEDPQLH